MKVKFFDKKRAAAKRYAKQWPNGKKLTERGNRIIHSYDDNRMLGWWDDVLFRFGSQVIAVWWTHPRLQYKDACSSKAYDEAVKQKQQTTADMFEGATPIYKQLGKTNSRKKVLMWRLKETQANDQDWRRIEAELLKTSDITIRPHMTIRQYDWCRGVDICLPIEVIDQKSLEDLADIVRSILRGEKKLEDFYPEGYAYGRDDWVADEIKMAEERERMRAMFADGSLHHEG